MAFLAVTAVIGMVTEVYSFGGWFVMAMVYLALGEQ